MLSREYILQYFVIFILLQKQKRKKNQNRAQEQKKRKVNRYRMKMNCVFLRSFDGLVWFGFGWADSPCVQANVWVCLCAFTTLCLSLSFPVQKPNLLNDPIYGCDIDSSCIPNIIQHFHNIVHFLCHSDCLICLSFTLRSKKPICARLSFSFAISILFVDVSLMLILFLQFSSFSLDSFGHSSSSTCSGLSSSSSFSLSSVVLCSHFVLTL